LWEHSYQGELTGRECRPILGSLATMAQHS